MKTDIKVLLLGLTALVIFLLYSLSSFTIGEDDTEIRKADFLALATPAEEESLVSALPADTIHEAMAETVFQPDTTPKKIFFFGDSMVDYLGRPFESYAAKNGHEIESVVWFSSTTQHWAQTDTLQYFLRKYDPSYVVICLGSNEVEARDIKRRQKWVEEIQQKLGDLPYVWVSPPNWTEEEGFTNMIKEAVGADRFFDSSHLSMERGPDHKHPTYEAAVGWMDTVASWMQSPASRYPIIMEKPEEKVRVTHLLMLKPYKLRKKKK
ncbi:MAG: hypothetical protein K2K81_02370 [Muribaculaceae bacterium]|nr:hypothetical protein [Muribaculaceae bacterium]